MFSFWCLTKSSSEVCENETDASHLALQLGEGRAFESRVFQLAFIILDNNNKPTVCMRLSAVMNVHMQTSKLDRLCISVSIIHALNMILNILATVKIQKSLPSAGCLKILYWVTVTSVLFSRKCQLVLLCCTWDEKADQRSLSRIDPHTLYTQNLLNLPHKPSYNN